MKHFHLLCVVVCLLNAILECTIHNWSAAYAWALVAGHQFVFWKEERDK